MACINYLGDIYVEITNKCNLKCKHCYNASCEINDNHILNEKFRKIIKEAKSVDIDTISLSGGEPLLNPDCVTIINNINSALLKCRVVTNGTMITEKMINSIEYPNNVTFQVSLHGSKKDIHNIFTCSDMFDNVDHSIEILKKKGIQYTIKTVINKYNMYDIKNIVEYGIRQRAKGVSVSFLQPYGRAVDYNDDIGIEPSELIQYYLDVLIPLFNKYPGYLSGPKVQNTRCPFIYGGIKKDKKYNVSPRIDVYGNVYPCAMFIQDKFSIGNIFENSLNDCFSSDMFAKLLHYIELRELFVDDCKKCIISKSCGKGCPACALEKDILTSNYYCGMTKWKVISDIALNTIN